MATTTGDNIFYRTTSTPAALEAESATQAASIQVAFDNRKIKTFKWANQAAQLAQTGMTAGDTGDRLDNGLPYRYDGTNWKIANIGLFPMKPTGVVGTNVVLNGSNVTFTTTPTLSVDGVFNANFNYYRVMIRTTARSVSANLNFRLRANGIDSSTTYSWSQINNVTGGAPTGAGALGTSIWTLDSGGQAFGWIVMDIANPFVASVTTATSNYANVSATMVSGTGSFFHSTTTQYDGFTIIPTTPSNLAGSIVVFGYNDSV